MQALAFETIAEGEYIRIPEQYIKDMQQKIKVIVLLDEQQTPDDELDKRAIALEALKNHNCYVSVQVLRVMR